MTEMTDTRKTCRKNLAKQDRECTYNKKLRRVHVTICNGNVTMRSAADELYVTINNIKILSVVQQWTLANFGNQKQKT